MQNLMLLSTALSPRRSLCPRNIIDLTLDSEEEETAVSGMPELKPVIADRPRTPPARVRLSEEQKGVLEQVTAGKSVFFTGSAGTGKSVLLREIIKNIRRPGQSGTRGDRKRLYVTASTGIASVNIGGTTVHSWAGIGGTMIFTITHRLNLTWYLGLGKEDPEKLAGKIWGRYADQNQTRLKSNCINIGQSGDALKRWLEVRSDN